MTTQGAIPPSESSAPTKREDMSRLYIPELYIDGIRPFNAPLEMAFDPDVNVLIGANATGKTTILRILAAGGKVVRVADRLIVDGYDMENFPHNGNFPWVIDGKEITPIYVPAMRPSLPIADDNHASAGQLNNNLYWLNIANIEKKLDDLRQSSGKTADVKRAIAIAQKCTQEICQEDFEGVDELAEAYESMEQIVPSRDLDVGQQRRGRKGKPTEQDLADQARRGELQSALEKGRLRNWVIRRYRSGGRRAIARQDSYPTLEQMCSGAVTTFTWILYIALRLAGDDFKDGWENKPAILLIDEIDNHLHVNWQRRVIRALRENFPGSQIFATSHSPALATGRLPGQVHLLERDEFGVIDTVANRQDTTGWSWEVVLRVLMGVPHPTDEATAKRLEKFEEEGSNAQNIGNSDGIDDGFYEAFLEALDADIAEGLDDAIGE